MTVPRQRDLVQLSFLYFPLTLFWTAMMSLILPERIQAMASNEKGFYMALIGALGAIVATVCMFVVGPLSDHTTHAYGRRFPWIVGGIGVGIAGAILFSVAWSLPILLVAFVLAQMGFTAALASYEAILPDRVPPEFQSRASGWGEFFDVLGRFAGLTLTTVLLGGALSHYLGRKMSSEEETRLGITLIFASACIAFVFVLFANLNWIRSEPLAKAKALPWRKALARAFAWRPSEAPNFARLYYSRCVLNFGTQIGISFLLYYVGESWQLDEAHILQEASLIGLYVTVGGVVGALVGGRLGDFLSKRVLLYIFCSLSALAAIGFCLTESLVMARNIGFFYGIGFSAINAVDWAFATNLVPEGEEARYLAIFQTSYTLSQILVMIVGGLFGQHFGFRSLFWLIPISLVTGMLMLSRVRERGELIDP